MGCHRLCKTFKWYCVLDFIRGDFDHFLTHTISIYFEEMVQSKPRIKTYIIRTVWIYIFHNSVFRKLGSATINDNSW